MSYEITEKGKKFIVSNQNTGRVVAAHKTKAKAVTQVKALYASEDGEADRMEVEIIEEVEKV
ncbi:MAG: hypothetical protein ACTSSH_00040 [Candidatus Heimdallarchaeota archaeon]